MIYAIILAGGKGERLWPLSRYYRPKQLLKVASDKTLLQQTINRIRPLVPASNIYVVTNSVLFELIRKQVAGFKIPQENILLEPGSPKNTAPAIGWAAVRIAAVDREAIIVVLPSDHFIKKKDRFLRALSYAKTLALRGDYLVTFGVRPDGPEIGYGYIKTSCQLPISVHQKGRAYRVEKFIEKPSQKRAKQFLRDKRYYCNSGIFVWKARVILDEIKKYLPGLYKNLLRINKKGAKVKKIWQKMPTVSIDYGIMEKSKRVVMVPLECDWTDLGSWDTLGRVFSRDKSGNIFYADSIDRGSRNIIVWGRGFIGTKSGRLIATIGLKDLIIVDTPDALLICKKSRTQEVKKIVEELKRKGREEIT